MAILGQIRKQTGLLIVVIGVAMLAFVAGDLFSDNSIVKQLFTGDPNEVGNVNGESITLVEFINAQTNMGNNPNMSQTQINQQVWNALVSQKLIQSHAEKAGLEVSDNEVWSFMAQQYGMGSADELKTQVGQIKSQMEQGVQGAGQAYQNFLMMFDNARPNILAQKYMDMVNMATLTTHKEAQFQQVANIQNASFDYGYVSYEDLKKKYKVEVTDSEITEYAKRFPKYFESDATVDLSYVYFTNQASTEDENKAKNSLSKLLTQSISVDEVNNITDTIPAFSDAKDDSAYVTKYSEKPFNSQFITRKEIESYKTQLPAEYYDFLMTGSVGQIAGPFKTGDAYQLVKISKSKEIADSINSSHILITYQGTQVAASQGIARTREEAQALADQVLAAAKANPNSFKTLVSEYSEDAGTKAKDGNLGYMAHNSQALVAPYMQFLNTHKNGEIGIAESEFGFHVIKIDGVKNTVGYQFANIVKEVNPSQTTSDKNFADARTFAQEVQGKSLNEFANLAKEKGFNYNTADNITRYTTRPLVDASTGFSTEKDNEILRWAFSKDTKPGSTFLFSTGNEDQIIVFVSAKYPKGLAPAKMLRADVEPILIQEKLVKVVNDELGANPSVETFASKFGAERGTTSTTFFAAQLGEKGAEPRVAGAAFGMKPGTNSKAIQGNSGVYVINLKTIGEKPDVQDATFLIQQLSQGQQQKMNQQLIPSMMMSADIKDSRMDKLDRQQM